jgi:hypothetical protein
LGRSSCIPRTMAPQSSLSSWLVLGEVSETGRFFSPPLGNHFTPVGMNFTCCIYLNKFKGELDYCAVMYCWNSIARKQPVQTSNQ